MVGDVSADAEMIKQSSGKSASQMTQILVELMLIESENYFEQKTIWEVVAVAVAGHAASKY